NKRCPVSLSSRISSSTRDRPRSSRA
ncbi:hypothetical protein AB1N83_013463, partial [Pleurotus pulmonarius]